MKLFGFLLLASVLLSCVRNVSEESVNGREIRFRSNIQDLKPGSLSRVDGFCDGDKVVLCIAERENADEVMAPKPGDRCEMSYNPNGSLFFTDELEHNYPDMPIDVYGYYWKGEQVVSGTLSEMVVSVETDQSEGLDNSDFLYVRAAEGYAKDAEPIELEFEHLFSKIVLNVETETPTTINLEQLVNVKLHSVVTTGVLDLGTGVLTNGEVSDEVEMPKTKNSVAIVLPQEIEGNKKLFSFQVTGIEEPFEVEVPANNFEQGKEYTYNVKVNKYPGMGPVEMQFSVSVKDWYSEEPYEIVIEKGEEVEVLLTEVAVGVNISKADLYLSSGEVKRELKGIVVVDNKMKFVFPRLVEGGSLRLEKAIFYTDNKESFEYYFENKELRGNNYDRVDLPAPKIGDAWAGGTIFVVGEVIGYNETDNEFETNMEGINAYRGRVVANESFEKKLEWCTDANSSITVGAVDENDGSKNMIAVKEYIIQNDRGLEMFPAFKACVDKGEGWYYPAINELKCIITHKEQLGEKVNLNSVTYGSSTEKGKDNMCVGGGNVSKYTNVEVRPVRAY